MHLVEVPEGPEADYFISHVPSDLIVSSPHKSRILKTRTL